MMLGKLPPQVDARTLQLGAVLSADLPPIPAAYYYDVAHAGIPCPMFANNIYGDCVIAARAHATLRFERTETGSCPAISDEDVIKEWRDENGGTSDGLVMLTSLKRWRKGWDAAGRRYSCHAFAAIDPCEMEHVQAGLYLFGSLQAGFALPLSVTRDLNSADIWDVADGEAGEADPEGGHAIALVGYDAEGLECVTWGRRQRMSWAFLEAYCDELYAVVDALDPWRERPGIDVAQLESYLRQVAA